MKWYQRISKANIFGLENPFKAKNVTPNLLGACSLEVDDKYSWMRYDFKQVYQNIDVNLLISNIS